jgi:RimJ/RimL family protein N-acetyltransferase
MTTAPAGAKAAGPGLSAWRISLPELKDAVVAMREVTVADAGPLLRLLTAPAVVRHTAPPPSTLDGYRRFARWSRGQRRKGTHICYAVVPAGETEPVGIAQIWRVDRDFDVAEWGMLIGEPWWGTGVARAAAHLLCQFAFHTLGAIRLEARCTSENHRARTFMRHLGAVHEGTLRHSARRHDNTITDQELWAVFPEPLAQRSGHQASREMAEC